MQFSDGYYNHHPMADYYNAMDPESYGEAPPGVDLGVKDIGMSVPMGISAQNVAGIYSKIRMGAGNLEIGFPGVGAGQRQSQTPEMYGKDQRQALRELGMINEIKFTTHAAYNVQGMTGQDQQGNFALTRGRVAQHEVERAIDFAADVAGGGSVVVHTGEFERPLTEVRVPEEEGTNYSRRNASPNDRLMFKKRLTEDADAQFQLVDDRTGQGFTTVQKDRLVAYPVWNRSEKKEPYIDSKGRTVNPGNYINYDGDLIEDPLDPLRGRVPKFNEKTGRFETTYLSWDDFKDVAVENNNVKRKKSEKEGKELNWYNEDSQTEAFLYATLETNEGHSRGWALYYGKAAGDHIKVLQKLKEAKKFYEKLDKSLPEEEKWKIMVRDTNLTRYVGPEFIPPDTKHPLEMVDKLIFDQEKEIEFARQSSTSQEQQAKDTFETKQHIKEPWKYIKQHSIRGYTEAALHAYQKTKDPSNPITLTLENIYPERFGGHPQELKWLVKTAREKMVDFLTKERFILQESAHEGALVGQYPDGTQYLKETPNPWYVPGMSKEEAEKIAERHIKATLDTGHLNLWKKFYQPEPGKTAEQNEADFKKWMLGQIEDLAKDRLIGNVHLTDNFGYHDDHIAPGQGNVPVDEVIGILKKHGYDKAITVEPGADASTDISDFHGLMKTWRHFGSPIYGVGMRIGAPTTWADVQYSYFGQNRPPYYIFGPYAPSNDWTLWSAVPME